MDGTDHQDIRILEMTSVQEIGDRVEVAWKLSGTPELEWSEVFQMVDVSQRNGALEWVVGGGPDVLHDTIRWFVPIKNVQDADAEVRHRVFMANGRLATEQPALGGEASHGDFPRHRTDSVGPAGHGQAGSG